MAAEPDRLEESDSEVMPWRLPGTAPEELLKTGRGPGEAARETKPQSGEPEANDAWGGGGEPRPGRLRLAKPDSEPGCGQD